MLKYLKASLSTLFLGAIVFLAVNGAQNVLATTTNTTTGACPTSMWVNVPASNLPALACQQPDLSDLTGSATATQLFGAACTATGSSPQTCNGRRGIVTSGTLTTAAVTDATFTINDSSAVATSNIQCMIQAYSGTYTTNGDPIIMSCVAGSGTITVNFRNVHATNALNGTIAMGFTVQ